ncbi:hypothetical protein CO046_02385 [Candidatus Peregrinibacteria bacterium CG_4_9_14_0_2_um_filter_53_11]|nr:MAG: hypothetical protein CO046_02385 [Candidatus Peregrinibacteria bacterium CG_4_9_14_0_2_um_filter_53_11]
MARRTLDSIPDALSAQLDDLLERSLQLMMPGVEGVAPLDEATVAYIRRQTSWVLATPQGDPGTLAGIVGLKVAHRGLKADIVSMLRNPTLDRAAPAVAPALADHLVDLIVNPAPEDRATFVSPGVVGFQTWAGNGERNAPTHELFQALARRLGIRQLATSQGWPDSVDLVNGETVRPELVDHLIYINPDRLQPLNEQPDYETIFVPGAENFVGTPARRFGQISLMLPNEDRRERFGLLPESQVGLHIDGKETVEPTGSTRLTLSIRQMDHSSVLVGPDGRYTPETTDPCLVRKVDQALETVQLFLTDKERRYCLESILGGDQRRTLELKRVDGKVLLKITAVAEPGDAPHLKVAVECTPPVEIPLGNGEQGTITRMETNVIRGTVCDITGDFNRDADERLFLDGVIGAAARGFGRRQE